MSLEGFYLLPEAQQQALLNGPALKPPPGIIPNFDSPPNENPICLSVTTTCLSLSTIAIILATYAKLRYIGKVHIEDLFVFVGYGLVVGVAYCIYEGCITVGFLTHQWNVRVRDIPHLLHIVQIGSIFYAVAIMFFKIAILLQWMRLFVPRGTKGSFFWTSHILLWTNALLYSIVVITVLASCKPLEKLWDKRLPGRCSISRDAIDVATACINLTSDIIILILPQPVIWKLRIKGDKKIGIAIVFLVGVFAVVSAAFRVFASLNYYRSNDKTNKIGPVALWGIAELTCAILIYCVPAIPKIFRDSMKSLRFSPSLFSWAKSPLVRAQSGSAFSGSIFKTNSVPLDSLCDSENINSPPSALEYPVNYALGNNDYEAQEIESVPPGILRTTRIVCTEEVNRNGWNENQQSRQPWG